MSMRTPVSLDLSMYIDRESDDYPIFLFELTHPEYDGVMRLCSSDVTRLGTDAEGKPFYGVRSNLGREGQPEEDFIFLPMSFTPPSQEEEGGPTASLTVWRNVELTALLRTFRTKIAVHMYQASAREPNLLRADYPGFYLTSVEIGGATVQGNIGVDMQEDGGFPGMTFDKKWFPGMHA